MAHAPPLTVIFHGSPGAYRKDGPARTLREQPESRREHCSAGYSISRCRHRLSRSRATVSKCTLDRPFPPMVIRRSTSLCSVDVAGLIITAVGTVAGMVAAYFAWVTVRPRLISRESQARFVTPAQRVVRVQGGSMGSVYDVFISYSHDDLDWVSDFARRLEGEGLRVARDEVFLKPGDVLVHALEQAIRDSAHGILVFSPTAIASGWVQQEYAALMQRSIQDGIRFIPVLSVTLSCPVSRRPGTTLISGACPEQSMTGSSPRSARPSGPEQKASNLT